MIKALVFGVISLIGLFIGVAFYTLIERKIISLIQLRVGPNKVSLFGICQPLLDAIKLFIKEDLSPRKSNPLLFIFFPLFGIVFSILLILLCEESFMIYAKELRLLIIFLIIALRVYPVYGVG